MPEHEFSSRINVDPEQFIPVPKHELVQALAKRIDNPAARAQFQTFCRIIDGIFHFEYHTLANELKEDFCLFDAVRPNQCQWHPQQPKLVAAEERFLVNFRRLMAKGNFQPLTQHEIDIAQAEDYLFNLPVTVAWEGLDDQMLSRFFQTHGYHEDHVAGNLSAPRNPSPADASSSDSDVPEFANRILIYRRGVGIDRTTGRFFLEKVDILVSKSLLAVWASIRCVLRAIRLVKSPSSTREASQPGEEINNDDPALDSLSLSTLKSTQHIHQQRTIQRTTLRRTNVNLLTLAKQATIQEPTFQELVILFRFATPDDAKPEEQNKSIHIKMFRDIPMADLEVVFPEKKISMQPLDIVKLVITGSIGLAVVTFKLLFSVALNPLIALAMLTSVLGYATKVALGFKASKDRYQHLVTTSLYDKNRDNDFGVIFYLVDAVEEQEFKEAVLAYFFLLEFQPLRLSESELDAYCERFLKEQFNVEIDFEVDDAIDKLTRLDIVEKTGARYRARPLLESLRRLDYVWDNYFEFNTSNQSNKPAA